MITDEWEGIISDWLNDGVTCEFLRISDIMQHALGFNPQSIKRFESMRVADVLKKLGYKPELRRVNNIPVRGWMKV